MAVGRDLVLVVEQTEPPMVRVSVDVDGRAIAEREQTPFVFLLKGHDLGEGAHTLSMRGGGSEAQEFPALQLSVVPDCLDVTRSLCVLVSKGQGHWTPPTAQLLPALENGSEPLRLLGRVCAQIGDREDLQPVRELVNKELDGWGGAALMLAQELETADLRRAVELLSAFTDVPLKTAVTPKALQTLARLCDDYGDYERGIAACKRLLADYPDDHFLGGEALLRMAYCLKHDGRRAEGLEAMRRLAEENRDVSPRSAAIAKADWAFTGLYREVAPKEAIRLTREALMALPLGDPARITLQARIAMYHQALGAYRQALAEYRKVPPGRGSDPAGASDCRVCVPKGMAEVLWKLGQRQEALQVLREAGQRYREDDLVVRQLGLELRHLEAQERCVQREVAQ